jgi:uncharacterized membrane protein YsdA (DUF1294 family)
LTTLYVFVAIGVQGAIFAVIYTGIDLLNPYAVWLISATITTFLMYGLDKSLAQHEMWRVPKKLLHVLALEGGFAGGWLGMLVWRHKSKQTDFWAVLFGATLIHGALVYYFFLM